MRYVEKTRGIVVEDNTSCVCVCVCMCEREREREISNFDSYKYILIGVFECWYNL